MPIEGNGIPAGATVAQIISAGAGGFHISAPATLGGGQSLRLFPYGYGSGGGATTFGVPDDRGLHVRAYDSGRGYEKSTLTATTTSGSAALTGISSTRGLFVGMPITGPGIPASTVIATITGSSSVTISNAATATATDVALTITGRQVGAEGTDELLSHTHGVPAQSGYTYTVSSGNAKPLPGGTDLTSNVTTATGGPENNVKRRIYMPIITIGA